MKRIRWFWVGLGMLGVLAWNGGGAAAVVPVSLSHFDLFGFPASAMDQPLGQRAKSLGQALSAAFPKEMAEQKIAENNYSGACFQAGSDQYKLAWMDSETEGFRFSVQKLTDQKTCANPFSDGLVFKSFPLAKVQFFPVSRSHSVLQLGVSTPADVQKELGVPAFVNSQKMIYVLKRDREKEKGCGADVKHGEFAAIQVEFDFSANRLSGIFMHNTIAGEC